MEKCDLKNQIPDSEDAELILSRNPKSIVL